ncbi:MAG: ATP-binding cassette domain-containing protein [Planctomycetes bacterium]|nr:ATP-binding cassette domain-containing protein [Planctomycetota bacterium]
MVHLEGIHKAFGSRQILRGVDLAVFPGETVCLIGGSGSGKSVSLKHIMRLIDPDRGKIWLDGEDITNVHGSALQVARSKLGVNFQFGALLNWMTIFENVALPLLENTRMKGPEIERRVMEKLELLSIPHARDLYPTQISGGMVKRAGLARAVVMEESLKVILYDEPTSGLDPISTAVVDEMVNELKARLGLTQIIVTHDMASAYRTADRIAVLHEGKLVQFGTPEEIQTSKVPYVAQFVGGLSTEVALDRGRESKRLRKSGLMNALDSEALISGDDIGLPEVEPVPGPDVPSRSERTAEASGRAPAAEPALPPATQLDAGQSEDCHAASQTELEPDNPTPSAPASQEEPRE